MSHIIDKKHIQTVSLLFEHKFQICQNNCYFELALCNHIFSHYINGTSWILWLRLFFTQSTRPVQIFFVGMVLKCVFIFKRVKYCSKTTFIHVFVWNSLLEMFLLRWASNNHMIPYIPIFKCVPLIQKIDMKELSFFSH